MFAYCEFICIFATSKQSNNEQQNKKVTKMEKVKNQVNITTCRMFTNNKTKFNKNLNDMEKSKITIDMMDTETKECIALLRAVIEQRTMFDYLTYKFTISETRLKSIYNAFDNLQEQLSELVKDSFDKNELAKLIYQQEEEKEE